jgi:hypothetical protein
MNRRLKRALVVILLAPCLVGTGLAQEREHHRDRAEWRGEIGRFHEHDIDLWRGGRWHHGRHEGRLGWWWIVGGVWYFYPVRVEPYPDPYQPPMAVVPPPPAPPQYWYYCADPAGYYPYVARCAMGWQRVEATAPSGAPPR